MAFSRAQASGFPAVQSEPFALVYQVCLLLAALLMLFSLKTFGVSEKSFIPGISAANQSLILNETTVVGHCVVVKVCHGQREEFLVIQSGCKNSVIDRLF